MEKFFFDRDPSKRVFLLYGNKGGTFFCPDFHERGIEEYLFYFLKNNGFDTVVFYSGEGKLYCFDENSARKLIVNNGKDETSVEFDDADDPDVTVIDNDDDEDIADDQWSIGEMHLASEGTPTVKFSQTFDIGSMPAWLSGILDDSKEKRHAVIFDSPNHLYDGSIVEDDVIFDKFCNTNYNVTGSIIIFLSTIEDVILDESNNHLKSVYHGYFLRERGILNDVCCIYYSCEQRDEVKNYLASMHLKNKIIIEEGDGENDIDNLADEILYCRSYRSNSRATYRPYTYLFRFLDEKIPDNKTVLTKELIDKIFEVEQGKSNYDEIKNKHGWESVVSILDPIVESGKREWKKKDIENASSKTSKHYVRRLMGDFPPVTNGLKVPNFALKGNPGTGKTSIARMMGAALKESHYLESGHVHEVSAADLIGQYIGQTYTLVNNALDAAEGGVLFIDECGQLAVDKNNKNGADAYNSDAVNTIIHALTDPKRHFSLVLAGYPDDVDNLLRSDDGFNRRIDYKIKIDDFSPDTLYNVFISSLEMKGIELPENEEDKEDLRQMFKAIKLVEDDKRFGNAGGAINIAEIVYKNAKAREAQNKAEKSINGQTIMELEDLGDYWFYTKAYVKNRVKGNKFDTWLDNAFNDLDGLDGIKKELKGLKESIFEHPEERFGNFNYILLGPAGCGKTTVAKIIGGALYQLGIRKNDNFVDITKDDLFQSSLVDEPKKRISDYLEKAHNGVLFFDEAYTLAEGLNSSSAGNHEDSRNRDVLEAIMHAASKEGDMHGLTIILAGYAEEMQGVINFNKGFTSRFPRKISLDAYSTDVLVDMLKHKAKGRFELNERGERFLRYRFELARVNQNFGNARYVDTIVNTISEKIKKKGGSEKSTTDIVIPVVDEKKLREIMFPSFVDGLDNYKTKLEEVFDGFYSVDSVKEKLIRIYKEYNDSLELYICGKLQSINDEAYNFIFLGKPGSGKTKLCRAIAESLAYAGIRKDKAPVIRDAQFFNSVGPYVSSCSKAFENAIQEAEGGVLFIDEAHNLGNNQEFLIALLKFSETYRTSTSIVLAGYDDETAMTFRKTGIIEGLIDMDAGLSRRFPERLRVSLNYSDDDLVIMAIAFLRKETGDCCRMENNEKFKAELSSFIQDKIPDFSKTPGVFIRDYCIPALRSAAIRQKDLQIFDVDVSMDFKAINQSTHNLYS